MGNFNNVILLLAIPYLYLKFEDDLHPVILVLEIKRKYAEFLSQKNQEKPAAGPMYDGCNMCVWKYCSPGTEPFNDIRFHVGTDVTNLYNAFSLVSVDRNELTNVLTKRSELQRKIILNEYKKQYQKPLSERIPERLIQKHRYSILMYYLSLPLPEFYARQFQSVIEGDLNLSARISLLETITSLPNCMLRKVLTTYNTLYPKPGFFPSLTKALKGRSEIDYTEVVVALANGGRDETTSYFGAWSDAKKLYKAVTTHKVKETNALFKQIFTTRSLPQLRDTIIIYNRLRGGEGSMLGDIRLRHENAAEIYEVVAKIALDHNEYFAGVLRTSLEAKNYKDSNIFIHLIRSRCGIDLKDISKAYEKVFMEPLIDTLRFHESSDDSHFLSAMEKLMGQEQ